MSALEPTRYSTLALPDEQAFAEWRTLVSPQYRIEHAPGAIEAPRGGLSFWLLGDLIANRTVFNPQTVTRDKRLVSGTPDHLVLQFWRSGGSRGEVDGVPVVLRAGHTVLANRRREVSARFSASDTVGLIVPRAALHGIDVDRLGIRLDPERDRLATARITSLFRQLPQFDSDGVTGLRAELLGFLRRLLDPSTTALDGNELDVGVAELARRVIDRRLGSRSLTPDLVAERVGVSRATLYRAFAAEGGLMRFILERRLDTAATCLADPLEMRSLSRIAADTGFKSMAHFSRTFRSRHDLTPRDWRQRSAEAAIQVAPVSLPELWNGIGS